MKNKIEIGSPTNAKRSASQASTKPVFFPSLDSISFYFTYFRRLLFIIRRLEEISHYVYYSKLPVMTSLD